jgi:hypothetical protein
VLAAGALGRGRIFARLLEYLAEHAVRGEVPKEFDISVDVFGKHRDSVDGADAQTRVHVYKLRAKLDAYYAGAGKDDPFRLEIPKGAYHLTAVANARAAPGPVGLPAARRRVAYAAAGLLVVSLAGNFAWWLGSGTGDSRELLDNPVWSGLLDAERPVLVVLGDHFFFGEGGSHVRKRDVAINSKEELLESAAHASSAGLVFETLTYLPKSAVFSLQTILPRAGAAGQKVTLKLVSELTSEDLHAHDVIYVGFVRAMAILRDYYFSRSNFLAEGPLYMRLVHDATGVEYVRSGPVPQHNKDYGLVARFAGPSGNHILVFSGIGDVGVLAAVRSLGTQAGLDRIGALLSSTDIEVASGFEVLLEAEGHSRTDLDYRVVGAYPLARERIKPPLSHSPQALSAGER